jgi:hypothetical protein
VVLEGLMGSGKSYLTDQPFALGIGQSAHIELDSFLRKPVDETTEYMAAIDADAANQTIMQMRRTAPMVIAEGPMAWPVVAPILQYIPSGEVRRVYLKRMSSSYPDRWPDGKFLEEECEYRAAFFQSIDRYHARERPWLLADVVFERVGRDDE